MRHLGTTMMFPLTVFITYMAMLTRVRRESIPYEPRRNEMPRKRDPMFTAPLGTMKSIRVFDLAGTTVHEFTTPTTIAKAMKVLRRVAREAGRPLVMLTPYRQSCFLSSEREKLELEDVRDGGWLVLPNGSIFRLRSPNHEMWEQRVFYQFNDAGNFCGSNVRRVRLMEREDTHYALGSYEFPFLDPFDAIDLMSFRELSVEFASLPTSPSERSKQPKRQHAHAA